MTHRACQQYAPHVHAYAVFNSAGTIVRDIPHVAGSSLPKICRKARVAFFLVKSHTVTRSHPAVQNGKARQNEKSDGKGKGTN
ncbi:uncharacterized protein SPSK_10675 [Sporothrix schenckii 1099-18]|uniref:Uncharacterized protein n=1 Tax=Sporothrix schenckii 1099-18 TaxID=1397361 RepID=A0A0F2LTU5_SPOSC|nr:uncharacterized protein SPSK_10675 [Sporothrix schenckii 1099-18]KJR80898.1 hypothetical protein SPSK_10675 [Sporothrix schenckii 1099-18]